MTREEALALKRFDRACTCGGYALGMNGRHVSQPHMSWCPQFEQYAEWYAAIAETIEEKDNGQKGA
jgi:hypothetical protein